MSNRLTFSLASLIFLIAFGLVFVPTSVMGHPNIDENDSHAKSGHKHPTITISADDIDGKDGIQVVDADTVVNDLALSFSVTLTLDNNVALRQADDSAIDADTFDISQQPVYDDRDRSIGSASLDSGTYTPAAGNEAPTWTGTLAILLTDDGLGTTTDAQQVAAAIAAGLNVELTIPASKIEADVARGDYYQTGEDGLDNISVSQAFTVVTADTTKPTLTITHSPADDTIVGTDKTVTFTFAFSEALGSDPDDFTADDVMVTPATGNTKGTLTAASDSTATSPKYDLPVVVTNAYANVTVSVAKDTVADLSGNNLEADVSETYTAPVMTDTTPPVVTITPPTQLTNGKAVFKIAFNEALGKGPSGFAFTDLDVTGGTATASDLNETTASTVDAREYALSVTPGNAIVTVSLRADAVADGEGNVVDATTAGATASFNNDKIAPSLATYSIAPHATKAGQLVVTLTFSEPVTTASIDIDQYGNNGVDIAGLPVMAATPANTYTVPVFAPGYDKRAKTEMTLEAGLTDLAGNSMAADVLLTYTRVLAETVPPTITIGAFGYMVGTTVKGLNCEIGNELAFTYADGPTPGASGVKTGSMVEASEVSVVTAGWGKSETGGKIMVVPNTDRSVLGVTAVTVKVAAGAIEDNNGNKSAETMMTFTVGPVLTIPAGGYIVVVRTNAYPNTHLSAVRTLYLADPNVDARQPIVQYWDCMPDLSLVFDVKPTAGYLGGGRLGTGGGGLLLLESYEQDKDLTKQAIAKGTVGISEIMWAQDQGIPFGRTSNQEHAQEQWIELHNFGSADVKVTLFDLYGTEAYHTASYTGEIDRVSNFNIGGRWEAAGKGQDGNSEYGVNFISMQRTTPTKAAENYNHGNHKGNNAGKWSKSGYTYLTRRAGLAHTGVLAHENLNYDFYGTPGRANGISYSGPATATSIPLKPFIINEVANRENRNYEWIEIRNTSDKEENLRNYMISIVKGIGVEEALFTFPNSDLKVAANGLVLVVATDPEDDGEHPLAVGHDVRGGDDQALGANANSARYIVAQSNERIATEGLPDNGEFVLVLRRPEAHDKANAGSKLKTHDWIVDIAGYHPNLGNPSAAPDYSALWPLKVFAAPNLGHNKLAVNEVHRRQYADIPGTKTKGGNNVDKTAFRNVGYTGIGYRRHAQNTAVNGGTPGYHDIRKNLSADVKEGKVTISEIMFDQGDGRYPQWIELYNSSPTEAVNLHANDGWRLVVENFDDGKMPVGQISGTLNFKSSEVQTILPQQTVLVASTRARAAGSTTVNSSVVFIPTRVFSVWADARTELGMTRSTDPILSNQGFHIELIDSKGNSVDEVGNLTRRRGRIAAQSTWEWSTVQGEGPESGARSSVIRRYQEYKDGKPIGRYSDADIKAMGTTAEGWVSAHMTGFRFVNETWYGHGDDYGTPGSTSGRPLPVSLSKFRPERLDDGSIVVRWITESELNNAGFNILRSDSRTGEFTKLNTQLIAGQGTTSERTAYEFKDESAKPNVVYYYQIQDVSLDGNVETLRISRLRGHISAAGKATTTWGELKALQ